jgi:hypothetical protein
VLLQVGFGGCKHLDGDELVAALLEAGDDVSNQATLFIVSVFQLVWWSRFEEVVPGHHLA